MNWACPSSISRRGPTAKVGAKPSASGGRGARNAQPCPPLARTCSSGSQPKPEFLEIEQQGVGIQHSGVVLIDAENAPLEDEERRNMAVAHVDHRNALALAALGDFRRGERAEDGGRGGIRHRPARALLEGVEPGAGRGGRVVQPAGGITLRFSEQGAPEVEAPDAVAFGMVPVILCGGNDEEGLGSPAALRRPSQKPGS